MLQSDSTYNGPFSLNFLVAMIRLSCTLAITALLMTSVLGDSTRWKDLYEDVFEEAQWRPNITAEIVAEHLVELQGLLGSAPEDTQKKEVEFWLDAAQLSDRKCEPNFEAKLSNRLATSGREQTNLKVYLDDLLLKQAKFCIESREGSEYYHKITNALERAGSILSAFKLEDGSVSERLVADYLAVEFDPLWPGKPAGQDHDTFNELFGRKITNPCVEVCRPYESNRNRTKYLLKSAFSHTIDPEDRVLEWYKLVVECKQLFKKVEYVFYEMPNAVTRYQYYEAPIKNKSQLVGGSDEHSWAYLFERVFKAAPADVIEPMSVEQVIDAMHELGSLLQNSDERYIPEKEKSIVKYWLELEQGPKGSLCDPNTDDWLSYHMSSGLPGVGSVPCNFKRFVEHIRVKHFHMCVASMRYLKFERQLRSIPSEDLALMKSIKPLGIFQSIGEFCVARAARHLASFLRSSAPSLFNIFAQVFLDFDRFNRLYNSEIYLKCEPIVAIRFGDSYLVDYLSNRYFAERLDERVRDWLAAESACKLLTNEQGKSKLFKTLPEAIRTYEKPEKFLNCYHQSE